MLRSKTFNKRSDLITFMRGQAIPVSAGTAIVQNSTGHYDLLYEDADAADDVVPNARPNAGVSYGEEDAVAVAGTVIEVSSFRTSVTGEALGAGAQSFSGPLANTYVAPGTVVISDGGGTAPAIADDRRGRLGGRAHPSVHRGSFDHSRWAVGGGSAQVSLAEIVSVTLTTAPAEMGKRWVSITPDAIADVTVRLTWEQAVG